jgi:hypothetical protein
MVASQNCTQAYEAQIAGMKEQVERNAAETSEARETARYVIPFEKLTTDNLPKN